MKFIVQVPKTSIASDTPHLIRKAENGDAYTMHQDLKEECSYAEACSLFKYYKAKTLKQNMYNSDFQYNLNMRALPDLKEKVRYAPTSEEISR